MAAEMLGSSSYLLWSGVAAVITGLVVWLLPVGWEWQGALFAVLTLLALAVVALAEQTGEGAEAVDAHLNQRGQQIVGRRFTLDNADQRTRYYARGGQFVAGGGRR